MNRLLSANLFLLTVTALTLVRAVPLACQTSNEPFSSVELSRVVKDYAMAYTNMRRLEASVGYLRHVTRPLSRRSRIVDIYRPTTDSDYVVSFLPVPRRWRDSLIIVRCSYIGSIHEMEFLAVARPDATVCLLYGFGDPDVECLFNATVMQIRNDQDALDFGLLYLETAGYYPGSYRTLVDSSNYSELKSTFASIHPPLVEKSGEGYRVRVSAVWKERQFEFKAVATEYLLEIGPSGRAEMKQDGTPADNWYE